MSIVEHPLKSKFSCFDHTLCPVYYLYEGEVKMKKKDVLPPIMPGERPKVLLVGNGINRCFEGRSWEDLIVEAIVRNNCNFTYKDIENMPPPMQIAVATAPGFQTEYQGNNSVRQESKEIAKNFRITEMKDGQQEFLHTILDMPADVILTTNYSNELEYALGIHTIPQFRNCQRITRETSQREQQFRLYQFSAVEERCARSLWHIHGEFSKPASIVIGHYYYGKLLRQIEDRVTELMRTYNTAKRKGLLFEPQSWVDYFLLGDVYIFGLNFSLAEQDLWWLTALKQRRFPETGLYYYSAEDRIDKDVKKMLIAYGGKPVTNIKVPKENNYNYRKYYSKVIEDITERMNKKE